MSHRVAGSTDLSMFGMVLGAAADIIRAPIFIFTFKRGITGATITTVIDTFQPTLPRNNNKKRTTPAEPGSFILVN